MRVLLDENLPHTLRTNLPGHEVVCAVYAGWSGIQNGEQLLTGDQNKLPAKSAREAACAVLTAQRWSVLEGHLVKIAAAIEKAEPGSFQVVQCGISAGNGQYFGAGASI